MEGSSPSTVLQGESKRVFSEGIGLIMNRWWVLQTAVENGWGGPHSCLKAQQLAVDVLSWFTQSKEPLYIDDLESILKAAMLSSFKAQFEDDSIEFEELAEKLMDMHEECLQGNFKSVEILREANLRHVAHPPATQADKLN